MASVIVSNSYQGLEETDPKPGPKDYQHGEKYTTTLLSRKLTFESLSLRFSGKRTNPTRQSSVGSSLSQSSSPPPPYIPRDDNDGNEALSSSSVPRQDSANISSAGSEWSRSLFPLSPRPTGFVHTENDPDVAPPYSYIPSVLPQLGKPIAIPQLAFGADIPFARAWPPCLAEFGVFKVDFLAFIDLANVLTTAHPTVLTLKTVAYAVGFIPVEGADAIELVLEVAASLLQVSISRLRLKRFIKAVNEMYWHPRGLHVRTLRTGKLKKHVGIGKKDKMIVPLTEEVVEMTTLERVTKGMEQWCAPLQVDPDLLPHTLVGARDKGYMERAAAWWVRRQVRSENKKAMKRRRRQMKRKAKGKKIKGNCGEKDRLRWLNWVVVQRLDEYEREVEEKRLIKEEKKKQKTWQSRMPAWGSTRSGSLVEVQDNIGGGVEIKGRQESNNDIIIR